MGSGRNSACGKPVPGRPPHQNATVKDLTPLESSQMGQPRLLRQKTMSDRLSASDNGGLLWDRLARLCSAEAPNPIEVMHIPHPSLRQKGPTWAFK